MAKSTVSILKALYLNGGEMTHKDLEKQTGLRRDSTFKLCQILIGQMLVVKKIEKWTSPNSVKTPHKRVTYSLRNTPSARSKVEYWIKKELGEDALDDNTKDTVD